MATTDPNTREAIFNRLDELFGSNSSSNTRASSISNSNSSSDSEGASFSKAKSIATDVSDKEYRQLIAKSNCTSYSKLQNLHECPRRYELNQLRAAATAEVNDVFSEDSDPVAANIDFAYGHAVGAGIQTYAATGNLVGAKFAAFLAWKAPWDAEKMDAKKGTPTGDKSLAWALYAVEKFARFWEEELGDWEILQLPTIRGGELTSDPAVEVAFAVDTANGFYHFGHIDAILIHKTERRLAVWEGKTTARESVKDAAYGNSYQALGYSVVVDAISKSMNLPVSNYEVFYIVYSSKAKEFLLLPFTKSLSQRAEWLQDLLLDHAMINKYEELGFYPKRGDSCINQYGRECEWYGQCQLKNSSLFPAAKLDKLESISSLKVVHFSFTLNELIDAQKTRA
jgi:PD-(D/E)XK nuclease superfamily